MRVVIHTLKSSKHIRAHITQPHNIARINRWISGFPSSFSSFSINMQPWNPDVFVLSWMLNTWSYLRKKSLPRFPSSRGERAEGSDSWQGLFNHDKRVTWTLHEYVFVHLDRWVINARGGRGGGRGQALTWWRACGGCEGGSTVWRPGREENGAAESLNMRACTRTSTHTPWVNKYKHSFRTKYLALKSGKS